MTDHAVSQALASRADEAIAYNEVTSTIGESKQECALSSRFDALAAQSAYARSLRSAVIRSMVFGRLLFDVSMLPPVSIRRPP
jgi:hypothetical protein